MNSNCLAGIACPTCDGTGPFNIEVTTTALMFDDGVEKFSGDTTWDDDSPIHCLNCNIRALVKDFSVENWPINVDYPIEPGDRLYFTDPDTSGENGSSGWYQVVTAPIVEDETGDKKLLTDEAYNKIAVKLVNDAGTEIEAYPQELSRKAPTTPISPS